MPHALKRIDLGTPALLQFEGPDAVRFLNGQLTQDVKLVAGSHQALPACITDHKGKLQFRVWLHARGDAILVEAPPGLGEEVEARLTRYLIADEVEVCDLSGQWQLHHLTGLDGEQGNIAVPPAGSVLRESDRYGARGIDLWVPAQTQPNLAELPLLEGDDLESLRIARGVPAWGRELTGGLLPPEAGLEATDISYTKGCYIGQEVISRIKSAGKLNRRLTRLSFDAALPVEGLELVDHDGKPAGELTSIAPLADGGRRHALAYLKRGAPSPQLKAADGAVHPLSTD